MFCSIHSIRLITINNRFQTNYNLVTSQAFEQPSFDLGSVIVDDCVFLFLPFLFYPIKYKLYTKARVQAILTK